MQKISYKKLKGEHKQLIDFADAAKERAYNPYSNFFVGAALRAIDDSIITGANVENASYGLTTCAERAAIFRANVTGYREFTSIAVIARGETFDTDEPTAPCGACLQVLNEFRQVSGSDLVVVLANTKKTKIRLASIDELLPGGFGPKNLGIDVDRYR